MNLMGLVDRQLSAAFAAVGAAGTPALVQPASRPEHGDYQVNGVMAAAKRLQKNPRVLAQQVVDALELGETIARAEIAGPGFINLFLADTFIAARIQHALSEANLGARTLKVQRVMVEYSSPNLAKEMHVGHLRSTIIGDALARILGFLGHTVIRQNHVGDWGTQFGMLTAYLVEQRHSGQATLQLADLEDFYRRAKQRFDVDPIFADTARDYVVRLQRKETEVLAHWQQFVDLSLSHSEAIYRRLNVLLKRADIRGESAYNEDLPRVVEALRSAGLVVEDEGAQVVYLDAAHLKDSAKQACIIQKKDGGYLYSTTDLSALRYRAGTLQLDRCLYVVDARQALHFHQVFGIARAAHFVPDNLELVHVSFGTMMGEEGKPFKTRSGDTVKLDALLDEAETRALALLTEKKTALTTAEQARVARAVGIGAIKYADLSKNRTSDYIFRWDQMLAFEGNTAPYLQYAYARIQSLFHRSEQTRPDTVLRFTEAAERTLAITLLQWTETLLLIEKDSCPHHLCRYLYAVAAQFMRFYESCPILTSAPDIQQNRLQLCQLTARTLRLGLALLGIEALDSM